MERQGDGAMVRANPHRKLEGAQFEGPCTVTNVCDNGTVQLSEAVSQTLREKKKSEKNRPHLQLVRMHEPARAHARSSQIRHWT